jgi:Uma2 family endonuclease
LKLGCQQHRIFPLGHNKEVRLCGEDRQWFRPQAAQMGWLIDPEDRSVIISRIDRNAEVIDEPSAMLSVPDFAQAIELMIDRLFGWLNLLPVNIS